VSTPIKRYNLTTEGEKLYNYLLHVIKHPFYKNGGSKNIPLKHGQFNLLREGLGDYDKTICKDEIPFFGHTLTKIGG
jgi:hypothetical protein